MASESSSTTPGSASGKPEGDQGQPITPGTVPPDTVPPDNVPLDAVPPDPITAEINSELARLLSSQSSGSVQQSLDLLKSASEIRKSNADRLKSELEAKKIAIDAQLATKHAYGSFLNAMLSPLVPLASLLTVAVTLYIGNQTVRSAQQQAQTKAEEDKIEREETRWKEFAESLEKASDADKLYKGGTYVTRLRAYSKAGGSHQAEIPDIAKQFLIGLSSPSAFIQVWNIVIKAPDHSNLNYIGEIAREKKRQFDHLINQCKFELPRPKGSADDPYLEYFGFCSYNVTSEQLISQLTDAPTLTKALSLKQLISDTDSVQQFLSRQIGAFLRENSSVAKGGIEADLSSLTLHSTDLSEVDFSKINLTGSVISRSLLTGSKLTSSQSTSDLRNANWWDAATVNQSILQRLIQYAYPNPAVGGFFEDYKITEEQYRTNVAKLCTSKLPICAPDCLGFGAKSPSGDAKCVSATSVSQNTPN